MTMKKLFAGMVKGPDGNPMATFRLEHPFLAPGNHLSRNRVCTIVTNEEGRKRHAYVTPSRDTLRVFNKITKQPEVFAGTKDAIASLTEEPVSRQTRRARERFEARYAVIA